MVLPGLYSLTVLNLLSPPQGSSHAEQLCLKHQAAFGSVLVSGEGADEGGRVDLLWGRLPPHALVALLHLLPQLLDPCNRQHQPLSSMADSFNSRGASKSNMIQVGHNA